MTRLITPALIAAALATGPPDGKPQREQDLVGQMLADRRRMGLIPKNLRDNFVNCEVK